MARRRREGTAVAVELLLAPPASGTLDPDAVELAVNTDKLRAAGASPGRPPPRLARNTLENRILWDDLPGGLKESISARTGPVTSGHAAADGQNSPLAAVLDTRDGKVFVKGLPSDHRLVITQAREAVAAPLAKGISPALLLSFDEAGWKRSDLTKSGLAGRLGLGHARAILDRPGVLGHTTHRPRPYRRGSRSNRRRFPAYAAADPAHIAVFARANVSMWNEIEQGRPVPWTQTMAAAARTWAEHRTQAAGRL